MKRETLVVLGVLIVVIIYGLFDRAGLVEQQEQARVAWETERTVLTGQIDTLNEEVEDLEDDKDDLKDKLDEEQDRLRDLGEQVEEATEVLSDLEKLAELDEELLKKYSKVAFLNENYVPQKLVDIDNDYVYDESRDHEILKEVNRFLEDMIEDAEDDDVVLWVRSAYRSFGTQAAVKTGFVITYGAGTANQFSAEQGFSEHQLGTTVDFTTEGMNGGLTIAFENTEAFKWLQDNAYKYGFIMSYPQGNAFYQYEPWHWRFVGRDLARHLDRRNLNFYDMDQRDIDEYLLEIFD